MPTRVFRIDPRFVTLRPWSTHVAIPIVAWFLLATTCCQGDSSITLTFDERTVCTANQDSGSVSLGDWRVSTDPVEIPVGDEPRMLAVIPGDRLVCVTTQRSQELAMTHGSGPPYLIQGTYRTIHEEDQFVRSFLGGRGFLTWAASVAGKFPEDPRGMSTELDALSQFVLALRPRPNPHLRDGRPRGEIVAAASRGREIFHSVEAGCSHCHAGPNFTRSGTDPHFNLADVGTGIHADIPSLNNVWETAPYLHDGRAKTLRDVITTHNPDDRHGKTSHLDAQQLDDLVAFLLAPHEDLK